MEVIFDQIYMQDRQPEEKETTKKDALIYSNLQCMPIVKQKHIRNEESDY